MLLSRLNDISVYSGCIVVECLMAIIERGGSLQKIWKARRTTKYNSKYWIFASNIMNGLCSQWTNKNTSTRDQHRINLMLMCVEIWNEKYLTFLSLLLHTNMSHMNIASCEVTCNQQIQTHRTGTFTHTHVRSCSRYAW